MGKTADYYRTHPKAREKKKQYDTEFEKKKEQRGYSVNQLLTELLEKELKEKKI